MILSLLHLASLITVDQQFVTNIFLGLLTLLFSGFLFFAKHWFDRVEEHMKNGDIALQEFKVLQASYAFLISDIAEAKADMRDIRNDIAEIRKSVQKEE